MVKVNCLIYWGNFPFILKRAYLQIKSKFEKFSNSYLNIVLEVISSVLL